MYATRVRFMLAGLLAVGATGAGIGLLNGGMQPADRPSAEAAGSPAKLVRDTESSRVAELIKQLGSDRFEEREAATQELDRILSSVLTGLEKAAKSDDAEVKRRSEALLKKVARRVRAKEQGEGRSIAPPPGGLPRGKVTEKALGEVCKPQPPG
jgi:hypothetical protein